MADPINTRCDLMMFGALGDLAAVAEVFTLTLDTDGGTNLGGNAQITYGGANSNVFAHNDDLASFVEAVVLLLDDDGALIIEAPYFANLVADTEYDTIYHEHLSYISVRPVVEFFRRFDMEVFDVQRMEIHVSSPHQQTEA